MAIVQSKYQFKRVLNKNCIGQPMTPGYWKSDVLTTIPVTAIMITYGGGIGGCNSTMYVKQIPLHDICKSEGIIEVETWDGEKYALNTKCIVTARQMGIAVGVYHSENKNFKIGDWKYAFVVKENETIYTDSSKYDSLLNDL